MEPLPLPPDDARARREAALARVVRLAAWTFGVPFAQLVRYEPGRPPVSYGHLGTAVPDLRAVAARIPPEAALVVVEDAAKDARLTGAVPPEGRFFAWAAIEAEGRALGALGLLDGRPHRPGPEEEERLLDLATLAADLLRTADDLVAAGLRLEEAEARFQALGTAVTDAVVIFDDAVVLDANEGAAALLGYAGPEALIGQPLAALAPAGLPAGDGLPALVTLEAADRPPAPHRRTARRHDGTAVPVWVHERPFPHEGRTLRLLVLSDARG